MAPSKKRDTKRYFEAAIAGNLKLIKKLAKELDNGLGLKKTFESIKDDKDRTALHFAAANGRCELCDHLVVKLKLDPNVRDINGYTRVHHAALGGHYCTVMDLIKFADVSATTVDGCTPMHFAASIGDVDIMKLLITHGAKIEVMAKSGTALHTAVANGQKDAVKFLLICPANPNLAIHHFFTPLLMSIVAEAAGSFECLELLLKAGADPNKGACSVLPLGLAAGTHKVKMVKCLLKHGANPNASGYCGLTPLEQVALVRGHEMMEILFPLTTRIKSYPDWSISGIENHINSSDIREQRVSKCIQLWKEQGKQAFQRKDYVNAIFWYTEEYEYAAKAFTEALHLDPSNKETENELKEVMKMMSLKK